MVSNKSLVIIDIKKKMKKSFDKKIFDIIKNSSEILALTSYSQFLIKDLDKNFITFHDLISINDFKKKTLKTYYNIFDKCDAYHQHLFLLRYIMQLKTYQNFIEVVYKFCSKKKDFNYNIIYITDTTNDKINFSNIINNAVSLISNIQFIDEIYFIKNFDLIFYKKNSFFYKIGRVIHKKNICKSIINKIFRNNISYDSIYYNKSFHNCNISDNNIKFNYTFFLNKLMMFLKTDNFQNDLFIKLYTDILNEYAIKLLNYKPKEIKNKLFTSLVYPLDNMKALLLKNNNYEVVFVQHGCYIYGGDYALLCETLPATINFVFNEHTKKMFNSLGAKKVYTVGSIIFNYKIKNKYKKYDYLYITYCANYSGQGMFSASPEQTSIDGNEIYKRHEAIIELFGTKFKDKKICIKIQPDIFTGNMLYVPFLELSKEFKNITIEFSTPISKLIEKSKYIISDYFSSEFINRELHYKRDIILFKGSPLALPEKTLQDMEKMFILVKTVNDLKEKIENIKKITQYRKRYNDIIEYYSSKKCDTKKVVAEILKKELNGR